jgi:lysophospholipase L1-like esterase
MESSRPKPATRLRSKLAASGLSVLATLGLLELALRVLAPSEMIFVEHGYFVADPELGVRLQPGFQGGRVSINSLGMIGHEASRTKPPGAHRILLLGDSFCFGVVHDRDKMFASLLEKWLRGWSLGAEVLNAGVPSWGTRQELQFLERDGLGLQPDLVLVAMFLGNDIVDNAGEPMYTAIDGYTVPRRWVEATSWWRVRLASILHRSALVRFVKVRLAASGEPPARALEKLYRHELEAQAGKAVDLRLDQHRREPRDRELLTEGWRQTFAALGRIQDVTRGRGIGLGVVLIPDDLQLNPEWHRLLETQGQHLEEFDFSQANQRLQEFCRSRSIPCLDLSRALFRAYRGGRRPYGAPGTPIDGHFNQLGERIAAREIEQFLARSGLLAGWAKASR